MSLTWENRRTESIGCLKTRLQREVDSYFEDIMDDICVLDTTIILKSDMSLQKLLHYLKTSPITPEMAGPVNDNIKIANLEAATFCRETGRLDLRKCFYWKEMGNKKIAYTKNTAEHILNLLKQETAPVCAWKINKSFGFFYPSERLIVPFSISVFSGNFEKFLTSLKVQDLEKAGIYCLENFGYVLDLRKCEFLQL